MGGWSVTYVPPGQGGAEKFKEFSKKSPNLFQWDGFLADATSTESTPCGKLETFEHAEISVFTPKFPNVNDIRIFKFRYQRFLTFKNGDRRCGKEKSAITELRTTDLDSYLREPSGDFLPQLKAHGVQAEYTYGTLAPKRFGIQDIYEGQMDPDRYYEFGILMENGGLFVINNTP